MFFYRYYPLYILVWTLLYTAMVKAEIFGSTTILGVGLISSALYAGIGTILCITECCQPNSGWITPNLTSWLSLYKDIFMDICTSISSKKLFHILFLNFSIPKLFLWPDLKGLFLIHHYSICLNYFPGLDQDFQTKLHGQHLVHDVVLRAMRSHFSDPNPAKVISTAITNCASSSSSF